MPDCLHLCVDMQRLFGPGSPWAVPWSERVLEPVTRIVERYPHETIFTRFIPPKTPADTFGNWREYYQKWRSVTGEQLDSSWLNLFPELDKFTPPAKVVDKSVYSPWTDGALDRLLHGSGVRQLIITGGESDVCVMAAVLGAIDRGYQIILPADALCSGVDETHDAAMMIYRMRFSTQVSLTTSEELLHGLPQPRALITAGT